MSRVRYLGVGFDPMDAGAVRAALHACTPATPYRYIVTPNVDHVVRLDAARAAPDSKAILAAYEGAWLSLCDSRILARLARHDGLRLPVVPGSDLTATLLREIARPGDRIALVGGDATTVAALAAIRGDLEFVQHVPPMGLRRNPAAVAEAAAFVAGSGARFALLAVGSPQQELVARAVSDMSGQARGTALCIGASIDFLTGRARRAPAWMQRAHLEWLHRLLSEPGRMWKRYLVEGPRIFAIRRRMRARRREKGGRRGG